MKTAIIFGSTGLVGNHLLNLLINDNYYSSIKIFVRGNVNIKNPKLEIINIDFKALDNYFDKIKGDDCFFCIGTTKKDTPDKNEYRRVEYEIPVKIASIAKKNNINLFMYVSSLGSNINTKNLYLKNKGETEEILKGLNFPRLSIIRPSLILGPRNKFRLGEFILQKLFKNLSFLFQGSLKQYRAIDAKDIAKAMINISKNDFKDVYFDSSYLQKLSKK
jgi:nucleoside-diphosphate-sugar epimerase|tara:strand:+ start:30 stop:686 length:657 start_codon:yes stop_codon:yes gene_type:complete